MSLNICNENKNPFTNKTDDIHRGWLGLEAGGVLLLIMVGTVLALVLVASLFSKNDISTEISNAQFIMNQTRGLLKTRGIYDFTDTKTMTGTLVEFGGVPSSMTVVGDASKGKATVTNVWGGNVAIAPVLSKKGFTLTYEGVPQEACVIMAEKMSETKLVSETNVGGKNQVGGVTSQNAGAMCIADTGSTGNNTMIFQSNN